MTPAFRLRPVIMRQGTASSVPETWVHYGSVVVTTDGRQLLTAFDIHEGQNVWQSMGGMEVGSVWGHGSYVAPDWTAEWLHRELTSILDEWASGEGSAGYGTLPPDRPADDSPGARASLRSERRALRASVPRWPAGVCARLP